MEESQKPRRKKLPLFIAGGVSVVMIAGYIVYDQQQKSVASYYEEFMQAKALVLNNPLAEGKNSKELAEVINSVGDVNKNERVKKYKKIDKSSNTEESQFDYQRVLKQEYVGLAKKKIDADKLSELIKKAQKEIDENQVSVLKEQEDSLKKVTQAVDKLKKNTHFEKSDLEELTALIDLANGYKENENAIGLKNIVSDLSSLTDTYTKSATEREKTEKKQAEAEKKALKEAIKNETYPSLGMLRGDIPNRGGVIALDILYDSPAYNAGFETANYTWDNSMVIVAIDDKAVEAAVIGDHNIDDLLKKIPLGSTVEVLFKDGSTKEVTLDLPYKKVDMDDYADLPDPGKDTDSNIYFGVKGVNMGTKNDNKEMGMEITSIDKKGSAWASDLMVGDIICRIDGYYISSEKDISYVMSNCYEDEEVEVNYIANNGDLKTTTVDLSKTID